MSVKYHRICRRHSVRMGCRRRRSRRLPRRHPAAPRRFAAQKPEISGRDRAARHRSLHDRRSLRREQCAGDRVHLGLAVSGLCHQYLRLGAEFGRRADQLHRLDRRGAKFRRLSWRRAGAHRHRAYRSAIRVFVPALVVGALMGVVSAASYLFVVDRPITAVDPGRRLATRPDPPAGSRRLMTPVTTGVTASGASRGTRQTPIFVRGAARRSDGSRRRAPSRFSRKTLSAAIPAIPRRWDRRP